MFLLSVLLSASALFLLTASVSFYLQIKHCCTIVQITIALLYWFTVVQIREKSSVLFQNMSDGKVFFPFLVLNSLSMLTFLSQWHKRLQMVKKAHIHLCAPSTWHSYRTPCFPNVSNYDCIQAFTAVPDIHILMEIANVTLKKIIHEFHWHSSTFIPFYFHSSPPRSLILTHLVKCCCFFLSDLMTDSKLQRSYIPPQFSPSSNQLNATLLNISLTHKHTAECRFSVILISAHTHTHILTDIQCKVAKPA